LRPRFCSGEGYFVPAKVEVRVVIAGIRFIDDVDQAVDGADLSPGQVAQGFFAG
jgi:hypothetical protein